MTTEELIRLVDLMAPRLRAVTKTSKSLEEMLMEHAIPSLNEEPGQVLLRIINEWKRATEVVRGMNNQPTQHAITRAINAEAGLEIAEGKLAQATQRIGELTSELYTRNNVKPSNAEVVRPRLMEGATIEAECTAQDANVKR